MSTFAIQKLASERALVTGHDEYGKPRRTILSTLEYSEVKAEHAKQIAVEDFDAAIEEFYAPIIEAAEAIKRSVDQVEDPDFFVETQAESEGTPAQPRVVRRLQRDTVILRLIESGNTDRLIWVDDTIEILAYEAPSNEDITVPELAEVSEDDAPF